MGKRLFVGNLSFDTSDADLRGLFSTVGTCVSVSIMMDRMTGRSRGFGFVEMSAPDEAQRAITQLNGRELQDRAISVSEARERFEQNRDRAAGSSRSFGPDLPPSRPPFRKQRGSRRGLRGQKRSL